MGVRWDSEKVARLRARIAELHDGTFQAKANKACGLEAASLVDEGFQKSRDPYGKAWAPLKRRTGMPLLDTGRLAASYSSSADAKGFTISSNVVYAAIHNYGGTVKRAPRGELRRYATSASGKRRRIGLYSKNKKSVRTLAIYGESSTTIPQRQMVPEPGNMPQAWKDAFNSTVAELLQRKFAGLS